jgi:hypothetical protein
MDTHKATTSCVMAIIACYCWLMGMFVGLMSHGDLHPDPTAVWVVGVGGGCIIALLLYIEFKYK